MDDGSECIHADLIIFYFLKANSRYGGGYFISTAKGFNSVTVTSRQHEKPTPLNSPEKCINAWVTCKLYTSLSLLLCIYILGSFWGKERKKEGSSAH